MALLKTVVTTQEKFDQKQLDGTLQPDTQYIIVNSGMNVDDRFKGTYYGVSYAEALTALETAYGTTEAGSYAILNPEGLPPKYAIWDDNETTPHWAIASDVIPIEISNVGHNVVLTLNGNTLSADFDDTYILNEIQTVSDKVDDYVASHIKVWYGYIFDYEAIVTKDPNTLYFITDQPNVAYLGTVPLWSASSTESFIYYGGATRRQVYKAVKNNLDFVQASATLPADINDLIVDETHIYVSVNNTSKIYKLLKSTLALETTPAGTGNTVFSMAQDTDYIYTIATDGNIRKHLKTDGSQVAIIASVNGSFQNRIVVDDIYIYVTTLTGYIDKYLKADLSAIGSVYDGATMPSIVVDDNYIYVGTSSENGSKVRKYDKTTLIFDSESALFGTGVSAISRLDTDGIYLYATGISELRGIAKILKTDLSIVASSVDIFTTGVMKVSGGLVFVSPSALAPLYSVRAYRASDLGYHTISGGYGAAIRDIDCI